MANVIHRAWDKLRGGAKPPAAAPGQTFASLVEAGESDGMEFKSTLRTNLHTGQRPDEKIHVATLKTIAGFLNRHGGTLVIGMNDAGEVVGLAADQFESEDKMSLHLVNLVKSRIGDLFIAYVHAHFEDLDGGRVLSVRCERGPVPAFLQDGPNKRFFVRGANATSELVGQDLVDYVKSRFK